MQGKTVFVIAHRLNTIRNANQILVLKNGRIEEKGTHTELMQKRGTYFEMIQEQQKAAGWKVAFCQKFKNPNFLKKLQKVGMEK